MLNKYILGPTYIPTLAFIKWDWGPLKLYSNAWQGPLNAIPYLKEFQNIPLPLGPLQTPLATWPKVWCPPGGSFPPIPLLWTAPTCLLVHVSTFQTYPLPSTYYLPRNQLTTSISTVFSSNVIITTHLTTSISTVVSSNVNSTTQVIYKVAGLVQLLHIFNKHLYCLSGVW
jgi:hypothetical protein